MYCPFFNISSVFPDLPSVVHNNERILLAVYVELYSANSLVHSILIHIVHSLSFNSHTHA